MRTSFASVALVLPLALAALAPACGSSDDGSHFSDDAGIDVDLPDEGCGTCGFDAGPDVPTVRNDFPNPVIDPGAPAGSPGLFNGDAGAVDAGAAGPCLYEPEIGTLFPNNWIRARFRFTTPNNENLFEIKIDVPNEQNPLVIYTTKTAYTLDKAAWQAILQVASGKTLHVRIRSAVVDATGNLKAGPFLGSEGDIDIAPVGASGTVVYWTTSGGTVLKGFRIGDETVQSVITPAQGGVQCVACHASTPDGKFIGLTVSQSGDGSGPAFVKVLSVDGNATAPSFLSASASALLARQDQHATTFSGAHWASGDHTVLTMLGINNKSEIVWTDLEATSQTQGTAWGILARNGDSGSASAAAWSHDGKTIVYTSTPAYAPAGTITSNGALFTVPYGNKQGGTAAAINGANDAQYHYYYPQFSADDQLIAFNRIAAGQSSYNNAQAEVFVLPTMGGTPTRLAANDPPACTGLKSPGVTNSWPKWSPEVKSANGKSYYFLVFASTRNTATVGPQLFMAPIVVSGSTVTTYKALYFWNQPENEHNHTPAWDKFDIPPPK